MVERNGPRAYSKYLRTHGYRETAWLLVVITLCFALAFDKENLPVEGRRLSGIAVDMGDIVKDHSKG